MTKRLSLLLATAVTGGSMLLTPSHAAADVTPTYVGIGTALKGDGQNPMVGSAPLMQLPLELELGWRVAPALELHLGGGFGGTVSLNEGGGWSTEARAGARWDFFRTERVRVGVDLSLGWSRNVFELKQTETTTDGLVAEPSLQVGIALTDSLSLTLGVLARAERLVGDVVRDEQYFGGVDTSSPASGETHRHQLGAGLTAMLRYTF